MITENETGESDFIRRLCFAIGEQIFRIANFFSFILISKRAKKRRHKEANRLIEAHNFFARGIRLSNEIFRATEETRELGNLVLDFIRTETQRKIAELWGYALPTNYGIERAISGAEETSQWR